MTTTTTSRANARCEDAKVADEEAIQRARDGDGDAFGELTDPYRRELLVHCYRMLGSMHDAEDALQDTLTSAWRSLDQFEARASVRTWLYRIATNRCLNALRTRSRHPQDRVAPILPAIAPAPTRTGEPTWLEPFPDSYLADLPDEAPGPDARVSGREGIGLAFVAATQLLPARQRATLVLRDVLGYRAAEVAEMLETSEDSVTSALKRARATIADRQRPGVRDEAPLPESPRERHVVSRFTTAFENGDVGGMVALLTDDAWLTMPPAPARYDGPDAIGDFFDKVSFRNGRRFRTVVVRANHQPALVCYATEPAAPVEILHGLVVLSLAGDRVAGMTRFMPEVLGLFDIAA
jgi:RNA polymerase sigma-70 factor (ECF subfamily)